MKRDGLRWWTLGRELCSVLLHDTWASGLPERERERLERLADDLSDFCADIFDQHTLSAWSAEPAHVEQREALAAAARSWPKADPAVVEMLLTPEAYAAAAEGA
jgi:hypothetical protein